MALGCVLVLTIAAPSNARDVRFAGHVRFAHTSCCGLNEVVLKVFGRADVRYRVCVQKPSGATSCKVGVTGGSGEPSKKVFGSSAIGTFDVVWKVGGRVVDRSHWINVVEGV
jgi:hypothetical protein